MSGFYDPFKNTALIVNQRWEKTGVPGEKTPDLPVQKLASQARTTVVRDLMFKSALLTTRPRRPLVGNSVDPDVTA